MCRSLSKLWAQLEGDWERFGYFFQPADGVPAAQQSGVMRINCIDCLDRTNVVQGLLGRKHLEATLARAGLLPPGATLETAFPAVCWLPSGIVSAEDPYENELPCRGTQAVRPTIDLSQQWCTEGSCLERPGERPQSV